MPREGPDGDARRDGRSDEMGCPEAVAPPRHLREAATPAHAADGAGGAKRPREERGSTSTVLHFALLCFALLYFTLNCFTLLINTFVVWHM